MAIKLYHLNIPAAQAIQRAEELKSNEKVTYKGLSTLPSLDRSQQAYTYLFEIQATGNRILMHVPYDRIPDVELHIKEQNNWAPQSEGILRKLFPEAIRCSVHSELYRPDAFSRVFESLFHI